MFNNNFYPYGFAYARPSVLGRLSSFARGARFNWSNILNNTQKTLNIINQAIPVMYQIKPIYNNAKTIFKVMGAVRGNDVKINTTNKKNNIEDKVATEKNVKEVKEDSPTFFL